MQEPRSATQRQDPTESPSAEALRSLAAAMQGVDWSGGMLRDDLRQQVPTLPRSVYLRLAASRRYHSAEEVLHDASSAESRAEGEFFGEAPDLPEAESIADGGPPGYGPSPLYSTSQSVDGGSAEDRGRMDTAGA